MKQRIKPKGLESRHDKLYLRKTLFYIKAIMKHFKSYKDEDDGN
jgi:hypothetical protein